MLNYKFTMPSGLIAQVVQSTYNNFEIWYEVDQDGRGENTREFGGEYETFEQAVERILKQVAESN